jgi:hypothetical protein
VRRVREIRRQDPGALRVGLAEELDVIGFVAVGIRPIGKDELHIGIGRLERGIVVGCGRPELLGDRT